MKRSFIVKLCAGASLAMLLGCDHDASDELVPPDTPPVLGPVFSGWDTIFPGCYIPAWPGSYWTYLDQDGIETTITAGDWHLLSNYHPYSAPNDTSHCCWVPTFNGDIMHGYLVRFGNGMPGPNSSLWKRLLPDSIYDGAHYSSYIQEPETQYNGDILTVDSTVTVNGVVYHDVVVASIHYELLPPLGFAYTLYFYVCDVGLIRSIYVYDGTVSSQADLIDYHIGN